VPRGEGRLVTIREERAHAALQRPGHSGETPIRAARSEETPRRRWNRATRSRSKSPGPCNGWSRGRPCGPPKKNPQARPAPGPGALATAW